MPDLQKVASEIQESGQRSLAVACDVTDAEQVADLVEQVAESLGPIEILVNNAGASGSHKFIDHPDELWDRIIAARKSVFKQAALLGYGNLFLLLSRQLTIEGAVKRVTKRMDITGQAVFSPYAEPGMDVDKPHQLEILRADLMSKQQVPDA